MHRRSLIVRSLWAACLLVGGVNHAAILMRHGLTWEYHGVGWASAAYWSSLTVLDPLVAALLFVRPKLGIVGTVLLITTNVNTYGPFGAGMSSGQVTFHYEVWPGFDLVGFFGRSGKTIDALGCMLRISPPNPS